MDLSVIIVSWNVKDKLKNNLLSLVKSQNVNFEIFVVDNASNDGTVEMVESDFPEVKIIANDKNLGFAKACNQAIRKSSGRYVLLLNPDMKVMPDTLSCALRWLDKNEQASIAGIHLIDENNNTVKQVRRFPKIFDQFLVASKLSHLFPFLMKQYLCSDFDYTKASKVDSIRGSCFFIRRSAIEKIGLLDERYFIWFEEVDYCHQAITHGLEVWYTPSAQAIDYIGQSFKQVDKATTQDYFKTSMLAYFKKWQPKTNLWLLRFGWWIGALIMKLVS